MAAPPAAPELQYAMHIEVRTQRIEEQTDPQQGRYAFAYTVRITNTGNIAAQLISRHWIIEDASGQQTEVKGLGVIGQQPLLKPGEHFEYTSGCPLRTPNGSMKGHYFCVAEDATRFEVPIKEFMLGTPRTLH
jgi:ApaG protein